MKIAVSVLNQIIEGLGPCRFDRLQHQSVPRYIPIINYETWEILQGGPITAGQGEKLTGIQNVRAVPTEHGWVLEL